MITEKEYRNHPAVSRSELWRISESPEKFKFYKDNPPAATPALIFGQLFHMLALQPELFDDTFAITPVVDRRTKTGREQWLEFSETSQGKTLITAEEYQRAIAMCTALRNAPYVNKLLDGNREQEFFWVDELTGEECKCRTDCLPEVKNTPIIVDLKSASKADTESFMKDAIKYGYDFQSAMYAEGVEKNTGIKHSFVFIVVEKEPPYSVNILQADELFMKRGYDVFRELIGIYHDCKTTGDWYGYLGKFKMINKLNLPAWLAKEIE